MNIKNDLYFMGDVSIQINTDSDQTDCLLTVNQKEEDPHAYQWEVIIPKAIHNPLEALEELKKEAYYNQGEAWRV
jgi:predicted ATP-dependent endonuclease of OLD family